MAFLSAESARALIETANALAAPGKGLLAADESTGTIKKRFDSVNVENTEVNRASYRNLLFSAKGLSQYISGAILFEETLYQKNTLGESMVSLLNSARIIPGIKVDKGLVTIPGTDDEKYTEGLDGLGKRCADYYNAGARFSKWRAALFIDPAKGKPSDLAISIATQSLARYAAISQANGLVPIVEPEILSDGSHSIEVCAAVTEKVLAAQYKALAEHGVLLEGSLLKPNMVTAGADYKGPAEDSSAVGAHTVRALKRTVPGAVAGIMFLSGGQSEEEATLNLNAICKVPGSPWPLSFSFGRALQASCLKAWSGKTVNESAAQEVLLKRAKGNSLAQRGKYAGGAGGEACETGMYVAKYAY